ncbi:MAG TPA: hypothetical protein VGO74_08040 [Modestobacter sp.]|nr:hypothetical protein [Modestobacter sp.]
MSASASTGRAAAASVPSSLFGLLTLPLTSRPPAALAGRTAADRAAVTSSMS